MEPISFKFSFIAIWTSPPLYIEVISLRVRKHRRWGKPVFYQLMLEVIATASVIVYLIDVCYKVQSVWKERENDTRLDTRGETAW